MTGKHPLRVVVVVACVAALGRASAGRADFEAQLLQKFQGQNQSAAAKLKDEIAGRLAQAATFRTSRPEHALELVRKNLERLEQDSLLPRDERAAFIRECQERLRDLKEVLAEKEKEVAPLPIAPAPEKDTPKLADPFGGAGSGRGYAMSSKDDADLRRRRGVGQAFAANAQVTPVVSADRRYVRIGVSGSFVSRGLGPFIPIQAAVPSVFPGPGPGVFTVGQPIGVFQFFLPQLTLAGTGLGTSVVVPAGGSSVLASYSSFAEARNEFGTPVLGKIPYLGRLFRNVGYGRSSQVSEVVVSPQIIIVR